MTDETETKTAEDRPGGIRPWMLVPAAGALMLFAVFLIQLTSGKNPNDIPSALIDRPAPEFALDPLYEGEPGFSTADLKQPGVKVVNIWASWCVPCRAEHPELEALAARGVPVYGINYKDEPANAKKFLSELGNPFALIGADRRGRVGIEWGAYGVPETFVIDAEGRVVHKHIGPIQNDDLDTKIMPAIEAARAG